MDPANRSLKNYVEGVAEPPTNDAAAVTKWLEGLVEQVLREKITTLVDCGGGDTALYRLVSAVPSLADDIVTAGVAPVAVYLLGPRTNGTSPRPAATRAARSASFACWHALYQTCTQYPVREIERGVGRLSSILVSCS
jgi:hypothetical protein